ncbi:MAG TPA: aldo/keto reductase [Candidatus Dormibacteraeota bacterium]|nr:aldo/keto reductase [Candidatus Dormibacteraeota bacterium]
MTAAVTTRMLRVGDVDLARIGLGTNRLTNTPRNIAFLRDAVAAGIGMIDTAHTYTGGESESVIGEALSASDGWVVATKGGYSDGRPEVLRAEIEASLRRLRTDSIELYYLHRVDAHATLEESLSVMAEYRDAGKIRNVGISAVTIDHVLRAQAVLPITAVQNHYNLAVRASDDVVDYCTEHRIVFVPYFPLRDGHPALERIAQRHGATPAQITLAWLLRRSPMMLPIPGTLSLEHVQENLGALDIALTDDEFQTLQQAP